MKNRLITALVAIVAALAVWSCGQRPGAKALPAGALRGYSVLLVTIDTLRVDRVGAYGHTGRLTPTVDRLASEGVRFTSARAHVPLTLPSHASLMTGMIPPRHGVRDNGTYRLDPAHPALAPAIKSAGYRTGAFIGAFVLDARFGLNRGFDLYDDRYGTRPSAGRMDVVERPAEQVTASAAAWIRAAAAPWFAWVHLYDPHEPYAAPEPFASRYPTAPYDAEVAYADAALGRLLDDLRSAGRLDRTLVVVTADHGEGLGDHGERTHGLFAYDSTLHVPLIVWCGGCVPPRAIEAPVGLVDVAPTILDLLGIAGTDADGRSLRTAMTGDEPSATPPPPVYFEALSANLTRNWAPLTGVAAGGLKFIDLPIPELYDLHADPGETQNLYSQRPDVARRLQQAVAAYGRAPTAAGSGVDIETVARLRALGYVASQPASRKAKFTAADDPKTLVTLDTALDDAMKLSGRGDHAAAAAMLKNIVAQRPDLPLAYDRLAFVLRANGRLAEAIAVLEQAAAKGMADAPALVSLGGMLQEAGRVDRSVAVLEAAVGMNAQDLEARSRLGAAYAQAGRAADAERTLRAVLDADPESAETLTNLGVLYLATGRRDEAIGTLGRAIAADPSLVGARNTLAVAYAQGGDLQRATDEWRQIAGMRPDDPDVLYNLGTALLQLNRPAEARPVLERFVAVAPDRYAADVRRLRQLLTQLP